MEATDLDAKLQALGDKLGAKVSINPDKEEQGIYWFHAENSQYSYAVSVSGEGWETKGIKELETRFRAFIERMEVRSPGEVSRVAYDKVRASRPEAKP